MTMLPSIPTVHFQQPTKLPNARSAIALFALLFTFTDLTAGAAVEPVILETSAEVY